MCSFRLKSILLTMVVSTAIRAGAQETRADDEEELAKKLANPVASDEILGGEKSGLGPTFVALRQEGPWTVGLLTNHIWSVEGDEDLAAISSTFLQPFVAYVTKTKTTFSLNTESTYNSFSQMSKD